MQPTPLQRHFAHLVLLLICGSILFVILRIFIGRYPGDAMRILGICTTVGILTSQWVQWAPIVTIKRLLARLTLGSLTSIHHFAFHRTILFCSLCLLYWILSHGITGLGIERGFGYDITFFLQAAFNAFENPPLLKSIEGTGSFFAHHFSPFLYFLQPLANLPNAPFIFYLLQDIWQALFLFFLITYMKQNAALQNLQLEHINQCTITPEQQRAALLLLFLANPFWAGLIHYEFHELAFVPAGAMALVCLFQSKTRLLAIYFCSAILCIYLLSLKETVAFSLFWWGLIILIFEKAQRRWVGLFFIGASLAVIYLYFGVILPNVNQVGLRFQHYYAAFGNHTSDILFAPIFQPTAWIGAIFTPDNALWFLRWFFCTAGLACFGWRWLLLALPDAYLLALASGPSLKLPGFQYGGILLVPVFCATIAGIEQYKRKIPFRVVVATVIGSTLFFATPDLTRTLRLFFSKTQGWASRPFIGTLQKIPRQEAIFTNVIEVLPFLAQRKYLQFQFRTTLNASEPGIYIYSAEFSLNRKDLCQKIASWQEWTACRVTTSNH